MGNRTFNGTVSRRLTAVFVYSSALLSLSCGQNEQADKTRTIALELTADGQLGFEDASSWSVFAGSATIVDNGDGISLVGVGGYVEVQNNELVSSFDAAEELRVTVTLPALPWGWASVYFDIPSQGIYRQYVGPLDLGALGAGTHELVFAVPAHVREALEGTFNDFQVGLAFAVPSNTNLDLDDISIQDPPSCLPGDQTCAPWNSRYQLDLRGVGWASYRKLSTASLQQRHDELSAAGRLPINVGAAKQGSGVEYSTVWRENVDGRAFKMHWDLTSSEYHALWEQYRDEGYRPLDVEGYQIDGNTRFAGIWVENREGFGWASYRNLTIEEYADMHEDLSYLGHHPVDIETYETGSGTRMAGIWYENPNDIPWVLHRNMTRSEYQTQVEALADDGYLVIDYESHVGGDGLLYDVIAEKPLVMPAFQLRTNRDDLEFSNLWREYRDLGYRPLDLENHGEDGDGLFGGLFIQNASRFDYPRKGELDNAAISYLEDQEIAGNAIPGLSVAVIQSGVMIYRRGFGNADDAVGKVAHGETVYLAASASKVFGGTLAAKLEEEGVLADGAPLLQALDMSAATSTYVANTPAAHTHTLNQLMSHTGCMVHYDGISDGTMVAAGPNYATAQAAAEVIFAQASQLLPGCTMGAAESYSTHAYTLLAAALESVTGRSVHELVSAELAEQFGLSSLRSMFATGNLVEDYERAVPYSDAGNATSYTDNSWKVFGGGLEMTAVDLARFGAGVLAGTIVSAGVRDNRLWNAAANSSYGVSWDGSTDGSGRATWEHGGSWSGARSHIQVYPNHDLVIAIMSNRRGHNPNGLADSLGNVVLAP